MGVSAGFTDLSGRIWEVAGRTGRLASGGGGMAEVARRAEGTVKGRGRGAGLTVGGTG